MLLLSPSQWEELDAAWTLPGSPRTTETANAPISLAQWEHIRDSLPARVSKPPAVTLDSTFLKTTVLGNLEQDRVDQKQCPQKKATAGQAKRDQSKQTRRTANRLEEARNAPANVFSQHGQILREKSTNARTHRNAKKRSAQRKEHRNKQHKVQRPGYCWLHLIKAKHVREANREVTKCPNGKRIHLLHNEYPEWFVAQRLYQYNLTSRKWNEYSVSVAKQGTTLPPRDKDFWVGGTRITEEEKDIIRYHRTKANNPFSALVEEEAHQVLNRSIRESLLKTAQQQRQSYQKQRNQSRVTTAAARRTIAQARTLGERRRHQELNQQILRALSKRAHIQKHHGDPLEGAKKRTTVHRSPHRPKQSAHAKSITCKVAMINWQLATAIKKSGPKRKGKRYIRTPSRTPATRENAIPIPDHKLRWGRALPTTGLTMPRPATTSAQRNTPPLRDGPKLLPKEEKKQGLGPALHPLLDKMKRVGQITPPSLIEAVITIEEKKLLGPERSRLLPKEERNKVHLGQTMPLTDEDTEAEGNPDAAQEQTTSGEVTKQMKERFRKTFVEVVKQSGRPMTHPANETTSASNYKEDPFRKARSKQKEEDLESNAGEETPVLQNETDASIRKTIVRRIQGDLTKTAQLRASGSDVYMSARKSMMV
jgi:hypothetical protein